MRKEVFVNIGKRSGKAYRRASELVQEIFEIYPNQTIFVFSLENYQEMMAQERCRAIDDFAEKMRNLNTLNCFMDYVADEIDLEELMHYASEEIAEQLREGQKK